MANNVPLVSVVVPVYNGTNFLRQAIESVLVQTYKNIEIIVVDDGSDDVEGMLDLLSPYASRIRLIRQSHSGIGAALNTGLSAMGGTLFSWLSHDDLYHPTKIETEVASYLRFPEETIIYSNYCYIDEHRRLLGYRKIPKTPPSLMEPLLLHETWLHGCAMMIPRCAIEAVGLFDNKLRTTQDYDFFFRLAARFPFRHVPETLVAVRLHKSQATCTLSDVAVREQDILFAQHLKAVAHSKIEQYTNHNTGEFYRHLYRRYRTAHLRRAASVAVCRGFENAQSVRDKVNLLAAILAFNRITISVLRASIQLKSSLRPSPDRLPLSWVTQECCGN